MGKVSVKAQQSSTATRANPASRTPPGEAAGNSAEQRQHMIAETAYYYAEQRGFQGGDPSQDWLQAEAEIDRRLKSAPRH
jgi:hypothetical protein